MIKAVKKLKLWSKRKKKRKTKPLSYYPSPPPLVLPPPPSSACNSPSCYSHHKIQPSAPPLPMPSSSSWFVDSEYTLHDSFTYFSSEAPNQLSQQEEIVNEPILPNTAIAIPSSYQQYMAPNPIYDMPFPDQITHNNKISASIFGCFINFGFHLFRCICPCFHIRQAP